jgi:type IV secretory pathway VirB10-like protein
MALEVPSVDTRPRKTWKTAAVALGAVALVGAWLLLPLGGSASSQHQEPAAASPLPPAPQMPANGLAAPSSTALASAAMPAPAPLPATNNAAKKPSTAQIAPTIPAAKPLAKPAVTARKAQGRYVGAIDDEPDVGY